MDRLPEWVFSGFHLDPDWIKSFTLKVSIIQICFKLPLGNSLNSLSRVRVEFQEFILLTRILEIYS